MSDKSATDQWQAVFGGKSATEEEISSAAEDSDGVIRAEESVVDDVNFGEPEDTLEDSTESKEPAKASKEPEAKSETSAKEVITVTDDQGRRRKIEIDYSDREATKKAHLLAAGMRKYQAERDQLGHKYKSQETELTDLRKNWQDLESAYQGGISTLVDRLEGPGAFKALIAKEIEKARFLDRASPDEVKAFQDREEADRLRKDYDKLRKDNEKFKEEVKSREEQSELKSLESRVNPAFFKYSYDEKLGSAEDESMFNEVLWTTSMNRLKPYEEQGLDLTPELIERTFRDVASRLNRRIGAQAEKKVSKVVEQKKQEAAENVQAKVKSSYNKSGEAEQLKKHIQSGDTGAIFKNWSTFGKLLGNRK